MKRCPECSSRYSDDLKTCPIDGWGLIVISEWPAGKIVLNKYRILEKLGQGGMGVVYKAEHMRLREVRALKVMSRSVPDDPDFLRAFNEEAVNGRSLKDKNIVRVEDFEQDEEGMPFIAMEYVEGGDLRRLLRSSEGHRLTVERALGVARGVASGLSAAHQRKLVHRDIKPENIMLGRDEEGGEQPKIVDFGIMAMCESTSSLGRRGYTAQYASPEQCKGMRSRDLNGQSDLYSLGIMLYEMLTGRLPFTAETPEGWLHAHLNEPVPPPSKFNRELESRPGVDRVGLQLLEKDRERRPRDAQELIELLKGAESQAAWDKDTIPHPQPQPKPQPLPQPTKPAGGQEKAEAGKRQLLVRISIGSLSAIVLLILSYFVWATYSQPHSSRGAPYIFDRILSSGHGKVEHVSFSADGRWLAASGRNSVRLWSTADWQEIREIDDAKPIDAIAFDGESHRLAVVGAGDAGKTATVRVWDLDLVKSPTVFAFNIRGADLAGFVFSFDGQSLAGIDDTGPIRLGNQSIRLWDVNNGRERVLVQTSQRTCVALSHDGRRIAFGGLWCLSMWDARNSKLLHEFVEGTNSLIVDGAAFSPDERWLATIGGAAGLELWDLSANYKNRWFESDHIRDSVYCVRFSPDSRLVAGCTQSDILLWEVPSTRLLGRLTQRSPIETMSFSREGRWLVSGGDDERLYLWRHASE